MVQIPTYGLLNTLFKLEAWFPPQLTLKFGRIYGITQIMTGAVSNVCNQVHISTLRPSKQTVNGIDQDFDNVNIFPFVKATYIVSLSHLALMENHINCTGMILNIKPVTHVLTLAINRQWLAMPYIIDE